MLSSVAVSRLLGQVDIFGLSALYAERYGNVAEPVAAQIRPKGAALPQQLWDQWSQTEFHRGIVARGLTQRILGTTSRGKTLVDRRVHAAGAAVRALSEIGPQHLEAVVEEFARSYATRSEAAALNMVAVGDAVVPVLEREITSNSRDRTFFASSIQALKAIGTENAWAALTRLLDSPNKNVAYAVARNTVRAGQLVFSAPRGFSGKAEEVYFVNFYAQEFSNARDEEIPAADVLDTHITPHRKAALMHLQVDALVLVAANRNVPAPMRARALEYLFERRYLEYPVIFAATTRFPVIRLGYLAWLSQHDYRFIPIIHGDPNITKSMLDKYYFDLLDGERISYFSDPVPRFARQRNAENFIKWEKMGQSNRAVLDMAQEILDRETRVYTYENAISWARNGDGSPA